MAFATALATSSAVNDVSNDAAHLVIGAIILIWLQSKYVIGSDLSRKYRCAVAMRILM